MQRNSYRSRLFARPGGPDARPPGLLAKVLTFATGLILVVVGLMFSLVILAVAAIVAAVVLGYLWWKTRDLRRRMQQNPPGGRVIEGEAVRDE